VLWLLLYDMMMNGRKEGWERELNIIIIHTNNAIRDSWD
jgi:hypothetical protein